MTISSVTTVHTYVGDGGQEDWPILFPFFSPEEVKAIRTSTDGMDHELVYGSDYSVVRLEGGGVCCCSLGAGERLTLYLDLDLVQQIDLSNTGILAPEILERGLDRLTLIAQQHKEAIERCVQIGRTSGLSPNELLASIDASVVACSTAQSMATSASTVAESAAASAEAARDVAMGAVTSLVMPVIGVDDAGRGLTVAADGSGWELGGTAAGKNIGTAPDQIPTNADITIPNPKWYREQTIVGAEENFLMTQAVTYEVDPTTVMPDHTTDTLAGWGTVSCVNASLYTNYGSTLANSFNRSNGDAAMFGVLGGILRYTFETQRTIVGYRIRMASNATIATAYPSRLPSAWNVKTGLGEITVPDTTVHSVAGNTTALGEYTPDYMFDAPQIDVKSIDFMFTASRGGDGYIFTGTIEFIFGKEAATAEYEERYEEYLTGYTTPVDCSASASSTYSPGSYDAWRPFSAATDVDTPDGGWYAEGAVPQWVVRVFAKPTKLTQYRMYSKLTYPTVWTLQGSHDGSTWKDIDAQSIAGMAWSWTVWFPIVSPDYYTHYRWYITAKGGANTPDTVGIVSMQLYHKYAVNDSKSVHVVSPLQMVLSGSDGDLVLLNIIKDVRASLTEDAEAVPTLVWARGNDVSKLAVSGTIGAGSLAALFNGDASSQAVWISDGGWLTYDFGQVAADARFKLATYTQSSANRVEVSDDGINWILKFGPSNWAGQSWHGENAQPAEYLSLGPCRYIRVTISGTNWQNEHWYEFAVASGNLANGTQYLVAGPDGSAFTMTPPVYDPISGIWSDGKAQHILGWVEVENGIITQSMQCAVGVYTELAPEGTTLPNPYIYLPIMAVQDSFVRPVVNNEITGVSTSGGVVRVWRL